MSQAQDWHLTAVLLLDRPILKTGAFWLHGRQEGRHAHPFQLGIGNWDPRPRVASHAALPRAAAWHFSTGVQEWRLEGDDLRLFRHHIFLVDRREFHEPEGRNKERLLHLALATDVARGGDKLRVRWRCQHTKNLAPLKEARLAAFVQQAPACADDGTGWEAVPLQTAKKGKALITVPRTLRPGLAWLRIGMSEGNLPKPTDRLLAELPLVITLEEKEPSTGQVELRSVSIGTPRKQSNVPPAWRQGLFPHPQSVSALDVTDDGRFIGVTTLAFRHDSNFWLLSDDGKVKWGRHVDPWAPFQAAVLEGGKGFGVGLAYSRFTDPSPTVSLFQSEKSQETALVDSFWDMGWLRYGRGDWRTGWPASLVGDLLVRARSFVFTVASHDGAWRMQSDGSRQRYPLNYQRPFRMSASGDGHVLAFGYLVPDAGKIAELGEKDRQRLRLPPALLTVSNALTSAPVWTTAPMANAPSVPRPPEPADEFPGFAEDFNMKPLTMIPFRLAASVTASGDGSRVALTEYGGWLRMKRQRGIGHWNPDHQTHFCPRQRGWLRVFGPFGKELATARLQREGLFDVRMSSNGDTIYCAPMSWFARGLAGRGWLPADSEADTVYLYNMARRAWTSAWRFPDAVADLALHPRGDRALVSCWDGKTYLVGSDGELRATVAVTEPGRCAWSADGRAAVIGTQGGILFGLDDTGKVRWRTPLPVKPVPPTKEPLRPIFDGVPIYSVGRVGTEHAYVGDIWLIKTKVGGIFVDTGGSSGIPFTWQRLKAAGVDPKDVHYVLLSHSHGDHAGAAYLWRTQGAKIVAPATAAFTVTWLMPTWSDYSIWVPCPIDRPLPLKRAGDEAECELSGVRIKAVFVPGHSFDSVVYLLTVGGKRIAFTGDIGFDGGSHILHRCWGDREKAARVIKVLRDQVLPFKPDHVFTGHGPRKDGTAFLRDLIKRSEAALAEGTAPRPNK
jgi:glyoxylase-like metal-dependent hydrolase (beta-lactamase superfamily II)